MFAPGAVTDQSSVHTNANNHRVVKGKPYSRKLHSARNEIKQLAQAKEMSATIDYLKTLELYIAKNQVGNSACLKKNAGEFDKCILLERIRQFGKAIMLAAKANENGAAAAPAAAQDNSGRAGIETLTRWAKKACPLDALYYATALRSVDPELSQASVDFARVILNDYLTGNRDKCLNAQA